MYRMFKNRNSTATVNNLNLSHTRSTLLNEFKVVENSAPRVHIHLHVLKVAVQHRYQAVKYPFLKKKRTNTIITSIVQLAEAYC